MIPLTKFSTKVNPLLLNTLQKVYLVRANVLQNKKLQEQKIDAIFEQLNVYQDGKGITILKKFDELFGLHEKFPEKQYELLNTSYTDAILITSILESKILIKEIQEMCTVLKQKEDSISENQIKVGRSNGAFIDMKIKKMYSNWRAYLEPFVDNLIEDINKLQRIPLGSKLETVNDKVNSLLKEQKEEEILSNLNKTFNLSLKPANDRLVALSEMSPVVELSATLSSLASVLFKFSNDVRFLSSGPRSGFGELAIPENEPGSSIMPGKVNPTQCESLTMVAGQVIGNHTAVSIANSSALFESNTFKPLIGNNTLRSVKLLSDGIRSFRLNCAVGIEIIDNTIQENLKNYNNMI